MAETSRFGVISFTLKIAFSRACNFKTKSVTTTGCGLLEKYHIGLSESVFRFTVRAFVLKLLAHENGPFTKCRK